MGVPYAEVIGDPVAHSKSPLIHNFWLKKLGLEGEYRAVRVTAESLPAYLDARRSCANWQGCNVTMPLKAEVLAHVDVVDPSSEWAGSANCLFRDSGELVGCNTDASGIAMAFYRAPVENRVAVVIGNGATARTAMWCLFSEAVSELRIVARDRHRTERVLALFRGLGRTFSFKEAHDAFSDAAFILNATPLGMAGFPAMPQSVLDGLPSSASDATVFDAVYDPVHTEFLEAAQRLGRRTVGGLDMLVAQARDSFGHFFDGEPEPEWDAELRALLTR